MDKKGQGLQLNVIVLIVLALITLIVIIAIFQRQMIKSEQNVDGVADPLEIKSRCLSTWKSAGYENYQECVDTCQENMDPDDSDCFFPT